MTPTLPPPAAPPACLLCDAPTFWLFCGSCEDRLAAGAPLPVIVLTPIPNAVGIYARDRLTRPWATWHGNPPSPCAICTATLAGGYWCASLGVYVCASHVQLLTAPPADPAIVAGIWGVAGEGQL